MLSEGKTIAEVCQHLEVVEATFHRWRNQYGGMKADVRRSFRHAREKRVNEWVSRHVAETQNRELNDLNSACNPLSRSEK